MQKWAVGCERWMAYQKLRIVESVNWEQKGQGDQGGEERGELVDRDACENLTSLG